MYLGWYRSGAYVFKKLRGVPALGDHHFIFSATAQRLSEYLVMVIKCRNIQEAIGGGCVVGR